MRTCPEQMHTQEIAQLGTMQYLDLGKKSKQGLRCQQEGNYVIVRLSAKSLRT